MSYTQKTIPVGSSHLLQSLLGTLDENLNLISDELHVRARLEGLSIVIEGEEKDAQKAYDVVKALLTLLESGEGIDKGRVLYCISLSDNGKAGDIAKVSESTVAITYRGKPVKCKTVGQKNYVKEIKKSDIVFSIGPAGTGKTYLAVCMAVQSLKQRAVEKIVLTRPAVEAGEKLGFLPGDMQTKVDPYLRPLYDALQDMLGLETYTKYMERGVIEIAPLAFMRGRTLSNSFVILDEAQNTTSEQMKMFLTRLGEGSKMVVTGDITQIDLPEGKQSGIVQAVKVLEGVEGIGVCRLTEKDVVRHPLVTRIVKAYENYENAHEEKHGSWMK